MCATTLEAPELSSAATEPVEVTTCAAVETTSELMERRLYTWTAPYERGVDLVHQTPICSGSPAQVRGVPR